MQKHLVPLAMAVFMALAGAWFLVPDRYFEDEHEQFEEEEENEEEAGRKRDYYEWFISRDPNTGEIPRNIRRRETEWVKEFVTRRSGIQSTTINNNYVAVGPTQNGGRTRALAFDVRYNGTSNRVVIAGGVQGGIFRSTDGGLTWQFVHPSNEIRSVTCVAQDPRPGFQDTWYAGTGEAIGSSFYPNAIVFGLGIFKSTDNGRTWIKLPSTAGASEFRFDNTFDFVHNIAVHPVTGDVYAATFLSIQRSTDGGTTWSAALSTTASGATNNDGLTDILINRNGTRLFAAFSGKIPSRTGVGVFTSTTGAPGSWTRVAGGLQNQPDSVAGWRAFNPDATDGSADGWGRIVLGLSANQDNLYVLVENYQQASNNLSEADLFRANVAVAPPFTWSQNLGTNLVAKRDGSVDNWFNVQGGYNMEIVGHPTQNNTIYAGGVTLIRSTDGFTSSANNYFMGGNIGGRPSTTYDDPERIAHVDYHRLRFEPSNPNRMIAASDGGLSITPDATAARVSWENGNSQYQTIQYYYVGIDPLVGTRNFYGGTQDNNTTFRDRSGILGAALPDSNDHYLIIGGDGGQAFMLRSATNQPYIFGSPQEQRIYRVPLFSGGGGLVEITPANTSRERFVTYFHLDEDNPSNLYFPSNDTLYRTNNPIGVSSSTWQRINSVDQTLNSDIFSMVTTRGTYTPNSMLFMGTSDGKVFRMQDPANSNNTPVNISPTGIPTNAVVVDMAVNPRNHDTLLIALSNYNIVSLYWTGNATEPIPTWQPVEGNLSLPSVRSVEIIVTRSGVEYYAGTTVGLFSTTTINGINTSWTRENGGPGGMMNTAIVQSLSSRWRDNVLVVGTHGNGMFTADIGNAISIPTSVNEPIRNDKNFIVSAFPTITTGQLNFTTGTMLSIRNVQVQVFTLGGQIVFNQSFPYRSGNLNVSSLPSGNYVLTITSPDRKYQFVRKFLKQ